MLGGGLRDSRNEGVGRPEFCCVVVCPFVCLLFLTNVLKVNLYDVV